MVHPDDPPPSSLPPPASPSPAHPHPPFPPPLPAAPGPRHTAGHDQDAHASDRPIRVHDHAVGGGRHVGASEAPHPPCPPPCAGLRMLAPCTLVLPGSGPDGYTHTDMLGHVPLSHAPSVGRQCQHSTPTCTDEPPATLLLWPLLLPSRHRPRHQASNGRSATAAMAVLYSGVGTQHPCGGCAVANGAG
jgi:hypothetical protein